MQVLVYHDLLGMMQHPHHAKVSLLVFGIKGFSQTLIVWPVLLKSVRFKFTFLQVTPKFCKQYARVGDVINKALSDYKEEVTSGSFPGPDHSPYKISSTDFNGFFNELQRLGLDKAASAAAEANEKIDPAKSALVKDWTQ